MPMSTAEFDALEHKIKEDALNHGASYACWTAGSGRACSNCEPIIMASFSRHYSAFGDKDAQMIELTKDVVNVFGVMKEIMLEGDDELST
jgi:hypothetical protein